MEVIVLDEKNIKEVKRWYLCRGKLLDYVKELKSDFYSFEIQRKIVKNQYLDTLLETVFTEEPIPVLTLTSKYEVNTRNLDLSNVEILDGLQRSYRLWCYYKLYELYKSNQSVINSETKDKYKSFAALIKADDICSEFISNRIINSKIIKDLCSENLEGKSKILEIEEAYSKFDLYFIIWNKLSSNEIIKKMLVLNAGQSPVTRTHQYELLFLHYLESIKASLIIIREKESNSAQVKRGNRTVGTFLFSSIIISLESLVSQKAMLAVSDDTLLKAEDYFDSKDTLSLVFEDSFLRLYSKELFDIDKNVCSREPKGLNWFVKDTSLSGFWGAIGDYIQIKDIQEASVLHEKLVLACSKIDIRYLEIAKIIGNNEK